MAVHCNRMHEADGDAHQGDQGQYRTNELVRRRMNFSSDAMADFEGLLEVNRKIHAADGAASKHAGHAGLQGVVLPHRTASGHLRHSCDASGGGNSREVPCHSPADQGRRGKAKSLIPNCLSKIRQICRKRLFRGEKPCYTMFVEQNAGNGFGERKRYPWLK